MGPCTALSTTRAASPQSTPRRRFAPGKTITGTYASGINDAGDIVGYFTTTDLEIHGFIDTGGTFTTIGVPGGALTQAFGINNSGTVAGTYTDSTFEHGFTDIGGTFTTINHPSATLGTFVLGINDAGVLVGEYGDSTGTHSFVDNGGTFTPIVDPAATAAGDDTLAAGINNAGVVVGGYFDLSNAASALGFVDIAGTFTPIDDPLGIYGTLATGINDAGAIVGLYTDATGQHGFIAMPGSPTDVPEPNSLALLATTALAGLGMIGLRQNA